MRGDFRMPMEWGTGEEGERGTGNGERGNGNREPGAGNRERGSIPGSWWCGVALFGLKKTANVLGSSDV